MKKQQKSDLAKRLDKISTHTATARAVAGWQTREHDDPAVALQRATSTHLQQKGAGCLHGVRAYDFENKGSPPMRLANGSNAHDLDRILFRLSRMAFEEHHAHPLTGSRKSTELLQFKKEGTSNMSVAGSRS